MLSNDIASFAKNGYLIIDHAIDMQDLKALQLALWHTIQCALNRFKVAFNISTREDVVIKCDRGLIALNQANPDYPLFVQACISRSPECYRLFSNATIINHMQHLLGLKDSPPLYLTNNGIIFTHPNNSANKRSSNIELEWHRDTFYTIPRSRFLHVWIPLLHDATESNGTLQICMGSHKDGIGKQLINPEAAYDHRYVVDPILADTYQHISLGVKLGQALIFDGLLIHRSGKNISDQVRCTLIGLHHDISDPHFQPLSILYNYPLQTPESYFHEIYGDKKVRPLLDEQATKP